MTIVRSCWRMSVSGSATRTNAISGWLTADRDVQHVDAERGAVALRIGRRRRARRRRSRGASAWFSIAGERLERLRRIADHPAVGRDEGDAGAEQLADAVGFGVERRRSASRPADARLAQELGGEPRFRHQRLLDASVGLPCASTRRRCTPATASAITAADSAARNSLSWKLARIAMVDSFGAY